MMDSWHSYPKVYAIGHAALAELLHDPVIVQEKVDGSQFSFGRFGGELWCKSKASALNVVAPEKMFERAVAAASILPTHEGWTYRAEYLQKPKHNALAYDRTPRLHLMVFDINTGHEAYLPYPELVVECARIGLEPVPLLFEGTIDSPQLFRDLLDTVSILGGQKIEGVVVKNYKRFGADGKALIGKFVSEAFKEVHSAEWKSSNPTGKDVLGTLIQSLKTPARWNKAVQHLQEAGNLEWSPRDIGNIIKEVQQDTEKECREFIAEQLTKWAVPHVRRGIVAGIPEWYKDVLLKRQFNE